MHRGTPRVVCGSGKLIADLGLRRWKSRFAQSEAAHGGSVAQKSGEAAWRKVRVAIWIKWKHTALLAPRLWHLKCGLPLIRTEGSLKKRLTPHLRQ